MTTSVFGVDHGVSKSLMGMARKLRPAKVAEAADDSLKLAFKPVAKKPPMTGPGSMRGQMDPSAWASRMAAKNRSQ